MSLHMPFIECLPQETTGEIFKHLPLKDAAHCEQLCKLAQEIILKQDCPLTQGKDLIARIKMCDNLLSGQSLVKKNEREYLELSGRFIAVTAGYPITLLLQKIPYVNWLYVPFEYIGIDFLYNSPYTYVATSLGAVCALTAVKTAKLFIKNDFEIKKISDEKISLLEKFGELIENDVIHFNSSEAIDQRVFDLFGRFSFRVKHGDRILLAINQTEL